MPAHLGQETKTTFIKDFDGRDIFEELEAGADIKIGAPIKMAADGKAIPFAAGDDVNLLIGTSIHERVAGEFVTVATRFRAIQFCISDAAVVPGPVEFGGYNATEKYQIYATSTGAAKTIGYSLDAAAATDEIIRVGLL